MNITKYSQFHLYLLTLHFLRIKNQLIPENSDERWAYGTIINRAYYSSYLYSELWLEKVHHFKVKHPWEFKKGQKRIGEHTQIRDALETFGKGNVKTRLRDLAKLRKKADYFPDEKISEDDLTNAIKYMNYIFNNLKFK